MGVGADQVYYATDLEQSDRTIQSNEHSIRNRGRKPSEQERYEVQPNENTARTRGSSGCLAVKTRRYRIAVLPGAQLVTALSQEQTKESTIETAQDRSSEPLATPTYQLPVATLASEDTPVAGTDADRIVLSVQILEIPAGSEESREWLAWLDRQPAQTRVLGRSFVLTRNEMPKNYTI